MSEPADWLSRPTVRERFLAKGIEATALTSDSVRSVEQWAAEGRQAREGEEGVKVLTYRQSIDTSMGYPQSGFRRPRVVTMLHASQTEPSKR